MKEVQKPWGKFIQFTENKKSTVKLIYISKGEELSLQSHKKRDETWYIVSGDGLVTVNDVVYHMRAGCSIEKIKRKEKHKVEALEDTIILEISIGHFDEDDIIRYQDKYGRVK